MAQRDLVKLLAGYGFRFDGQALSCRRCKRRWRMPLEISNATVTFLADHRRQHLQQPEGYPDLGQASADPDPPELPP